MRDVYAGEIYLCKNLEVKVGGGRLLKGDIFSGTYSVTLSCINVVVLELNYCGMCTL